MAVGRTRFFLPPLTAAIALSCGVFIGASAQTAPAKKHPALSYAEAQLAREQERQHNYYDGLAKNEVESARVKAAQLRAQAAEKPMQRYVPSDSRYIPPQATKPGYYPGNYPGKSPVYVSQDLEYAKMKEDMAREKEERLKKTADEKAAGLKQSLDNMQSQMKESHVPGAAVAKQEGSNLFVRYYGPSPNSKPYEVHAAAARIVPHE